MYEFQFRLGRDRSVIDLTVPGEKTKSLWSSPWRTSQLVRKIGNQKQSIQKKIKSNLSTGKNWTNLFFFKLLGKSEINKNQSIQFFFKSNLSPGKNWTNCFFIKLVGKSEINKNSIVTPVTGTIFGPLSQTDFSKSEFKNEISSFAWNDIQMTLLCVCGVDLFISKLEHWIETPFHGLFS